MFLFLSFAFAGYGQDCSAPDFVVSYATMNTSTSRSVAAENLTTQKAIEMENFVNEVGFASHTKSRGHDLDGESELMVKNKFEKVMGCADIETCRSPDPVVCDFNPHMWIGSENGFKLPLCKDHDPQHPCPTSQKVVVRDDVKSSFRCIYPTTSQKSWRTASYISGRRIRKKLPSKNCKVAAKYGAERFKRGNVPTPVDFPVNTWSCRLFFETCTISFVGGYKSQFNFNKRNSYKNRRSQMNIPFKKRKLFDGCFSNESGRESSGLYLEIMEYFKFGFLLLLF